MFLFIHIHIHICIICSDGIHFYYIMQPTAITATHCNHCNTLQCTATVVYSDFYASCVRVLFTCIATHRNHNTHCSALQQSYVLTFMRRMSWCYALLPQHTTNTTPHYTATVLLPVLNASYVLMLFTSTTSILPTTITATHCNAPQQSYVPTLMRHMSWCYSLLLQHTASTATLCNALHQ